jgi:hypothetical protein
MISFPLRNPSQATNPLKTFSVDATQRVATGIKKVWDQNFSRPGYASISETRMPATFVALWFAFRASAIA